MGSENETRTTENSTQTSTPIGWASPVMESIAGQINQLLPGMRNLHYTGNFIAQPGGREQALPGMYEEAGRNIGELAGQAQNAADMSFQMPTYGGPNLGDLSRWTTEAPRYTGTAPTWEGDVSRWMGEAAPTFKPGTAPTVASGKSSFADYDAAAVQPVVEAAIAPLMRNLTENILPGLQSAGIESGAYGSAKNLVTLPSQAMAAVGREASEVATDIAYKDFARGIEEELARAGVNQAATGLELEGLGRNLQAHGLNQEGVRINQAADELEQQGVTINQAAEGLNQRGVEINQAGHGMDMDANQQFNQNLLDAFGLSTERGGQDANTLTQRLALQPDLLSTIAQMTSAPVDFYQQAANMERDFGQRGIDEALSQHELQLREPFQGLDIATDLISRLAGGYGTQTGNRTSTQVQETGGLAPILSGLMGAGMMAMGMPGLGPAAGGMMSSLFRPRSGGVVPPGFG